MKKARIMPGLLNISYDVTLATQPAQRFFSSEVSALDTRHQSGGFQASRISLSQSLALSAPQRQRKVVMPRFRHVGKQKGPLSRP